MQPGKNNLPFRFSAPLRRGMEASWSWWINELGDMLPPPLRRILIPRTRRLLLELDGTDIVVSQLTAQNREELTRYPPGSSGTAAMQLFSTDGQQQACELVLCLPQDKVLTRTLTLPLAAGENLREVLAFEMDHQTPFTAEQVYYDFSVVARSTTERTLTVELVLTTRQVLDELLARLDKHALHPDRATINCSEAGGLAGINLLPAEQRQRKAITPRLVNLALGTLALLLLVSIVALPLMNKHNKIRTLEPVVEAASSKADEALRLRKEVDELTANARFLIDKKQSSLPVLQVMDELTRILPDDTWITRLDIKGTELQIQGQSASAAALIPLIESSSLLKNPRFRSPVTRIPRSDSERFHLSAEIQRSAP